MAFSLVGFKGFMTMGMTQILVISDTNDLYSVWATGVISDKSFIALQSLLAMGFFSIQLSM
jgi:hypothetical protein